MHHWPPRRRRVRTTVRRVVPVAAAVLAAAVPSVAGAQAVAPSVNVIGDSVIVTGQPFGNATVQVTRPDALTGKPVVIGQYSGMANPSTPFTVNTTTPTALGPNGDCWQAGALSQALTPDIRPGDTVTVTGQPGLFGGTPSSTSVTVPADGPDVARGPIPACKSIAPFAQNAATAAPKSVSGGAITVSGVAQPLATGVSTSVTDGSHSTAPVDAAPNAGGTWAATTPASQVDALANGSLTVNPVFTVPDVSTGAPAHIAGAPISLQKTAAGQATGGPGRPGSNGSQTKRAKTRVSSLRVQSPISLSTARLHGLTASFVVPHGARVIEVRLLLGKRTLFRSVVSAGKAGKRQTVRLNTAALRRVLGRGRYTLALNAGSSRKRLGTSVKRTIRVR